LATRSAAKAHRQSVQRGLRNRAVKSATKTAVKHANDAIASADPEAARAAVREAIRRLDVAARKGVIHANNAGRRKSRLLLKYNVLIAAMQVPSEQPAAKNEKPAKKLPAKKPAAKKPAAKKAPAAKAKETSKPAARKKAK